MKKITLITALILIVLFISACSVSNDDDNTIRFTKDELLSISREIQAELHEGLEDIREERHLNFSTWVPFHSEENPSFSIAVRINIPPQAITSGEIDLNSLYADVIAIVRPTIAEQITERNLPFSRFWIPSSLEDDLSISLSTEDFNRFTFVVDDQVFMDDAAIVIIESLSYDELTDFPFAKIISDYYYNEYLRIVWR